MGRARRDAFTVRPQDLGARMRRGLNGVEAVIKALARIFRQQR
jgi:hypothetical protein